MRDFERVAISRKGPSKMRGHSKQGAISEYMLLVPESALKTSQLFSITSLPSDVPRRSRNSVILSYNICLSPTASGRQDPSVIRITITAISRVSQNYLPLTLNTRITRDRLFTVPILQAFKPLLPQPRDTAPIMCQNRNTRELPCYTSSRSSNTPTLQNLP